MSWNIMFIFLRASLMVRMCIVRAMSEKYEKFLLLYIQGVRKWRLHRIWLKLDWFFSWDSSKSLPCDHHIHKIWSITISEDYFNSRCQIQVTLKSVKIQNISSGWFNWWFEKITLLNFLTFHNHYLPHEQYFMRFW